MENEEIVETEARLAQRTDAGLDKGFAKGHDAVAVYAGIPQTDMSEDTPLLQQEHTRRRDSGNGGSPSPPNAWAYNTDHDHLSWWRRPSVFWMVGPFLIVALAYGGIIVTKLNLIQDLLCEQYFSDQAIKNPTFSFMPVIPGSNNPQCRLPEVSKLTSEFMLYAGLLSGLPAAVIAPLLGAYSDRHGRTKVLSITSLGTLAGEIITVIVARRSDIFSVYWILIGYFCEGLCGSFVASMAISNAYASDCTPPARRVMAFGYLHGCLFTGIAIGPLVSSQVVKATGNILAAFYVAIAAHSCFIPFMFFVIPESLSRQRQFEAGAKWALANPSVASPESFSSTIVHLPQRVSSFMTDRLFISLKVLYPTGPGSSFALRRNLILLAAVDTTCFGVAMGAMSVVLLYGKLLWGWENEETNNFVSIVNICRCTVLFAALPAANRAFRGPLSTRKQENAHAGADAIDLTILRVGIVFDIIGFVGYAAAQSAPAFIVSGALASFGGVVSPTLQSALTRHVPPDRTGQVLGAVALLHAVARVVSPTIFNGLYALTVKSFPQTVFVCLAAAFGVGEVLSWFVRPHVYFNEPGIIENGSRPQTATSETVAEEEEVLF